MTQPTHDSHRVIAREFMTHKGYPDLQPYDVRKLPEKTRRSRHAWRLYYELPGGHELELDVWWTDGGWWNDDRAPGWDVLVHDFYNPAKLA